MRTIPRHLPDRAKVTGLYARLSERVLGQPDAVEQFVEAIRPGELGLSRQGEPRSFSLLTGPTGTGKTKAVLEASDWLYPSAHVGRIDMAEYSTVERIPRLLGSALDDEGILGKELGLLESTGGHFLLLDEIEKAHKAVSDMFLGMEAARITLASGRTVDLSAYHICVTTNLGSKQLSEVGEGIPAEWF